MGISGFGGSAAKLTMLKDISYNSTALDLYKLFIIFTFVELKIALMAQDADLESSINYTPYFFIVR
jgi:hypothetical protein